MSRLAQVAPAGQAHEVAALRPLLLRLARLQLRNEAWAEDAVSEAMLAAVEGLATFRETALLRTWVVGILKHKIIDQFRRNGREVSLDAERDAGADDALEALFRQDGHRVTAAADWGDPERTLGRSQLLGVLQACAEQLPATLGRAFLLREWLGMETAEICKELGVTPTNCFVILYRARMRLRECLDQSAFAGARSVADA